MEDKANNVKKVLIFRCKICGYEFITAKDFIEHKKLHSPSSPAPEEDNSKSTCSYPPVSAVTSEIIPICYTVKDESRTQDDKGQMDTTETDEEADEEENEGDQKNKTGELRLTLQPPIKIRFPFTQTQKSNPLDDPIENEPSSSSSKQHKYKSDDNSSSDYVQASELLKPVQILLNRVDEGMPELFPAIASDETLSSRDSTRKLSPVRGRDVSPRKVDPFRDRSRSRSVSLKGQESSSDIYAMHPCSVCQKIMYGNSIPPHRRKCHPEVPPFQCFECPFATTLSDYLCKHRKCHRKRNAHKCSYCTASFQNVRSLLLHAKIHSDGKKKKPQQKLEVRREFESDSNLRRNQGHMLNCGFCDRVFTAPSLLLHHERTHTRPFRCNQCQHRCAREVDLRSHKFRIHGSKTVTSAPRSPGSKGENDDDWTPLRSTSDQRRKVRRTPSEFRAKLISKSYARTEFKCHFCSRVFPNPSKRKQHETNHTRPFHCLKCGHRSASFGDLKKHQSGQLCRKNLKGESQHLRQKYQGRGVKVKGPMLTGQYKCRECPYSIRSPALLNRHFQVHLVRKEYDCPNCTASFGNSGNRDGHVKSVHLGIHLKRSRKVKSPSGFTSRPPKLTVWDDDEEEIEDSSPLHPRRKASIHPPGFYNHEVEVPSDKDEKEYEEEELDDSSTNGKQSTYFDVPDTCRICQESFCGKGDTTRKQHFLERHPGLKVYMCGSCPFATSFQKSFLSHSKCHEGLGEFKCDFCSASFEVHHRKVFHTNMVHGRGVTGGDESWSDAKECDMERMEMEPEEERGAGSVLPGPSSKQTPKVRVRCPHCEFSTIYPHNLQVHLRRLHKGGGSNGDFECPRCSATFERRASLVIHLRNSHGRTGKVVPEARVEPCRMKSPIRNQLPKRKHAEPGLKCKYCEKVLPNSSKLRSHEWGHTRPFRCHLCSSSFTRPADLERHVRQVNHGPPGPVTRRSEGEAQNLPTTTSSQAPQPPQGPNTQNGQVNRGVPCNLCLQVFPTIGDLRNHNCESGESSSDSSLDNLPIEPIISTKPSPNWITGERTKGERGSKVTITQQNGAGLKITAVRFI